MRPLLLFALLTLACTSAVAQCDTAFIAQTGWTIPYVDSEELTGEGPDNGHAIQCIDGDSLTFWHTQWQAQSPPFPHEIQIDLGAVHAVNGVSLLSRAQTTNGKVKGYELYLSMDGVDWGTPQSAGNLTYADPNAPSQRGTIHFGAVDARYVRMVMLSNYDGSPYVMVAEFDVSEFTGTGCGATGQDNQIVTISPIATQTTTASPITLSGTAGSGLPLAYSVVSGPASIAGSTLTLDGTAGTVTVRAEQAGDAVWYPASATTSFEVLDLSTYDPVVTTKLTDAYPIEMPALYPYALYAEASIEEPDFNSITSVVFSVDGAEIPAQLVNGVWQAWWTPASYGVHAVAVTATASNGNTATETLTANVVNTGADQTVATFDDAVIDLGSIGSQWYQGSYTLPQSVGTYNQILAHLSVSCPNVAGGCDDWDRLAYIEAKAPNGEWVEIIRYITPYGVACDHWLDVTDFASILQGNTDIRMYIETWGTGGWKLNLDFTYAQGAPQYLYSTVQRVWHGNYNFGDPADLQPMDTVTLSPGAAQSASLRLVTTGHGWGDNNTGNAAEFFHAIHHVYVNGTDTLTQNLWNSCNPNPDGCSPQFGTWQYNRAGWCPGSIAAPFNYDLTPLLADTPLTLAYIFQPSYTDICHPNNPDCVSGVTCPDCNAGYNPYYRVSAYLIAHGNAPSTIGIAEPSITTRTNSVTISPNPGDGRFNLQLAQEMGNCVVTLHDVSGTTLKTWFFTSKGQLESYHFDVRNMAKGTYFLKVQNRDGQLAGKLVVQ
ncbi:MAG: discoidin domain-containing protein [Bacteroidetes bacterium]|nr:discoidin domain-containing protein [Bacteroidota bacterium]MBS1939786.1 discoidin domain-containing protein [Bacteroidota bacterium]